MARVTDRPIKPQFSQPVRQIMAMIVVLGLVGMGGYFAYSRIYPIFLANPWLNGLIFAVFVMGILACFWQLYQLVLSVSWIEGFASDRPGETLSHAPSLLAPLAAMLGARGVHREIATSSARSILDSVGTRIDEARDITRYLSNLLIFLGLLGTFYGLATTVPAVVETIRALAPQEGDTAISVFDKLMGGLEKQLGGMGTAFSSSLLGLAGSLVVGLIELFVTHGQNRFYRELEEWISTITRISLASSGVADGEGGISSAAASVLDHMAEQIEALQAIYVQSDVSRSMIDERLGYLVTAIERLATRLDEDQTLPQLKRVADSQAQLVALIEADTAGDALHALADSQTQLAAAIEARITPHALGDDGETRMRLRSIDVQLLRLLEELSAGRQESMAELRNDFAALTRALLSTRAKNAQGD
ncbi:biopolymer transporter ExbB [Phaeovulum sp.]|uniref:biopolymer transporter ExbB n=1 Tax=Phaeovulum sp. TaxID=2934796 RepID=UPI003563C750